MGRDVLLNLSVQGVHTRGNDTVCCLQITVAKTPDGRADSVTNADGVQYFALPLEERMPFRDFIAALHASCEVSYAQAQNNR